MEKNQDIFQQNSFEKKTILVDRFMANSISIAGILVILAILGIFVFISIEVVPLFSDAEVKLEKEIALKQGDYLKVGVDEWGALPFVVTKDGEIQFIDFQTGEIQKKRLQINNAKISAIDYKPKKQELVIGTSDGRFTFVKIKYSSKYLGKGKQKIFADIKQSALFPKKETESEVPTLLNEIEESLPKAPVIQIAFGSEDGKAVVNTLTSSGDVKSIKTYIFEEESSMMGPGEMVLQNEQPLLYEFTNTPSSLILNQTGDMLIVADHNGTLYSFGLINDRFQLKESWQPFQNQSKIKSRFLLGDVSLSIANQSGENVVYSQFRKKGEKAITFGQTKNFHSLNQGIKFLTSGLRNKAFLIGSEGKLSLRYSTTESIRWESEVKYTPQDGLINGKNNAFFVLGSNHKIYKYKLNDPHPEASIKALFGKIWYEGQPEPSYNWQSTGGTDDFEPKLSLIPLIIGTLKGTLYAMLFSIPIALLAALYTSQFMHKKFKAVVKPTMEIMASFPSVILGFLAALWLAPLIENHVPLFLICLVLIPIFSVIGCWLTNLFKSKNILWISQGYEFLIFAPMCFLAIALAVVITPGIENLIFAVTDTATGQSYGNFKEWWPQATGTTYEQRNSLVVGFMMGFAVIPLIFTVAEDALSNVPNNLKSASLALGASRWQTATRIVLPTALSGIFSALIIGLGRAVGETMIVVMATGNTPIMEWNVFSGMRTLSANIAVELPEAPHSGTLYRTLFLGALVLFLMTFILNTVADVLRTKLRKKYKTI